MNPDCDLYAIRVYPDLETLTYEIPPPVGLPPWINEDKEPEKIKPIERRRARRVAMELEGRFAGYCCENCAEKLNNTLHLVRGLYTPLYRITDRTRNNDQAGK